MVARAPSLRVLDVAADETIAQRRQAKEEQDSAAATAAQEAAATETPPEIVGDKKAKTYYAGTCRPEKEIVEANKVIFKTADEAEKAGFKLAKNCH